MPSTTPCNPPKKSPPRALASAWIPLAFLLITLLGCPVVVLSADTSAEHAANEKLAKSTELATPAQVQTAIDKAIKFIYSQQKKTKTWESSDGPGADPFSDKNRAGRAAGQFGGETALAAYALLSAGEDPKDPNLAPAVKFLEGANMVGVYAIGMRCQVWHMMPDDQQPGLADFMERDKHLLEHALRQDPMMYDYIVGMPGDGFDHSVSQYGVLGMWALQECGQEVPLAYWVKIQQAWENSQLKDGGWDYARIPMVPVDPKNPKGPQKPNPPKTHTSTPTMTAAGIASLFLAEDEILEGTGVGDCKGNINNEHVNRALDWMDKHYFDLYGVDAWKLYYGLYGIERIGVASGRIYFGDTNWFDRGAQFLVHRQKPNGCIGADLDDTCFALLFLTRGRAPVTINKLQYFNTIAGKREEGDWNERPRDVANFNPWVVGQVELDKMLNWQVVNLDAPDVDLHSAPLMFVAGSGPIALGDADQKKLKHYIDTGGTVLFNADCASEAFAASVMHLGTQLYPQYEFRRLTADDILFHREIFPLKEGAEVPKVYALSNGVRNLMFLLPDADLSRAWQARHVRTQRDDFELGADILMYASDKDGIVHKGVTYIVQPDPKIKSAATLKVARIKYNGVWDPEPYAWTRMAAIMHNQDKIDLDVKDVELTKGSLTGFKVAVLTGTGKPHIDDDGWAEFQNFAKDGGTLIVDSAGGSPTSLFTPDVHDRLAAFANAGDQIDSPIPLTDPYFTKTGPPVKEIHFRPFSRGTIANMSTPDLRGIRYGNRIGVFFSTEDLTAGLVGQRVDGIVGYEPEYATQLVEKMLLYAKAH